MGGQGAERSAAQRSVGGGKGAGMKVRVGLIWGLGNRTCGLGERLLLQALEKLLAALRERGYVCGPGVRPRSPSQAAWRPRNEGCTLRSGGSPKRQWRLVHFWGRRGLGSRATVTMGQGPAGSHSQRKVLGPIECALERVL